MKGLKKVSGTSFDEIKAWLDKEKVPFMITAPIFVHILERPTEKCLVLHPDNKACVIEKFGDPTKREAFGSILTNLALIEYYPASYLPDLTNLPDGDYTIRKGIVEGRTYMLYTNDFKQK